MRFFGEDDNGENDEASEFMDVENAGNWNLADFEDWAAEHGMPDYFSEYTRGDWEEFWEMLTEYDLWEEYRDAYSEASG